MTGTSSKHGQKRDLEDVLEEHPEAEHGTQGEMANENQQAGPNSARAGEPVAPQTGNPRAEDRRPN